MTITREAAARMLGVEGRSTREIESRLVSRLVYLGYTCDCSRCGGCGNYSFNPTDGTRCFGCAGSGKVLLPLDAPLVAAAAERIAAGELIPYFDRLKRVRTVKQMVKSAWDAWKASEVGKDYSAHRMESMLSEEERNKRYDLFFASPLYIINKRVGDICSHLYELEQRVLTLNVLKDAELIDEILAVISAATSEILHLDAIYKETKVTPVPFTPVYASFQYLGRTHKVPCMGATDAHRHSAFDSLRKRDVIAFTGECTFEGWSEMPEEEANAFLKSCSGDGERERLTQHLIEMSESREAVEHAVRE